MTTRRALLALLPLAMARPFDTLADEPPARSMSDTGAAPLATPPLGTPVTLPDLTLLDGRTLPSGYWRGRVAVIEMWASWCPFCNEQNPHLDVLHRRHREAGLEVLALSIDRDSGAARRYLQRHAYQFSAAMFETAWQAVLGRPPGLPVIWVIGRDARVKQIEIGEMFPEDIAQLARWL